MLTSSARHCTEMGQTLRWRWMKAYFKSTPLRSTPRFSQDARLHPHARQLGPEPADFHLLGTHGLAVNAFEFALALCLAIHKSRWICSASQ